MYPFIFIGPLKISTHLISNMLTLLLFVFLVRRRTTRVAQSLSVHDEIDSIFYLFIGVITGAWLGYTLPYLVKYILGESVPLGWIFQGTHWMGAVAGGWFAGSLYSRRNNLPFWQLADCYAPVLALALAIGRTGCLLYGDAYGRLSTSWLAVRLPDVYGVWAYRFPTQYASMIMNGLIAAGLFAFEYYAQKKLGTLIRMPFDGFLFLLYIELYCIQRFIFEFWRGDMPILFGPFTWTHLYCLIGTVMASLGIMKGLRNKAW
jgi:phosphatidylglycerol:prolipoprotein diacylglycerol transferase